MNRNITNIIRFFIDELVPRKIRNSKYFMYPFYLYAYRGRNIKQAMNFKKLVYQFSEKEYHDFYNNLNSISRNRKTDLNIPSLKYILSEMDKTAKNMLDVGCGKGYFLNQLANSGLQLTGFDIVDKYDHSNFNYVKGNIEQMPFEDNQFDVVTCFHTLEHIINLDKAVAELKRVARKQVIIAVPCQRYFFYTLDEHINFFPNKEDLTSIIKMDNNVCEKLSGDWVYMGIKAHSSE